MPEKDKNSLAYQLNITGTFTTDLIKKGLDFWFKKARISSEIRYVGFNQVFQQLINPSGEFNHNRNQINCVMIRLEDILLKGSEVTGNGYKELKEAIITCLNISGSFNKLIVMFCPPSESFEQYGNRFDESVSFEEEVFVLQNEFSNLIVIKSSEFTAGYGLKDYYNPFGEKEGNIPYKENFYATAATLIVRKIHASGFNQLKAIIVDCDNTLWQGVVGEAGARNVVVGKPEIALQKFLISQYKSGILICLCSKNIEKDVWDVFEQNEDMLLKREHISFFRINWEPKSSSLKSLATEINIGLDSFVFIDDNPLECEEIKTNAPSVMVILKRSDTDSISYILNSWLFDRMKVTEEDRKRSEMYRMEANRSALKTSVKSYKDFIKELNIEIKIQPVTKSDIPRISQLTFRTNQFNFTTRRRSEDEINQLLNDPMSSLYLASLNDRFGDYGIIGAFIAAQRDEGLVTDTFLLSCRALGKGVEHEMISFLGKMANKFQKQQLIIEFKETEKNIVAREFLKRNFTQFGVVSEGSIIYTLPVEAAVSFSFDPEQSLPDEDMKRNESPSTVSLNIIERNAFFDDNIRNYFTAEAITDTIYKTTPEQNKKVVQYGSSELEDSLLVIWKEVLDNQNIQVDDIFFDIGGDSILIPKIGFRLLKELNVRIKIVDIFQYPTIRSLAEFIKAGKERKESPYSDIESPAGDQNEKQSGPKSTRGNKIAVVGMSGRFPGAKDLEEYWQVISKGVETISRFSREELARKGVPEELLDNPDYVYANGMIETGDEFDPAFFGITPLEASCMDPQHRVFLETSYEALENSGYNPDTYDGSIGVFAGSGPDNYLFRNLSRQPETIKKLGELQILTKNGKDFLTTFVSYKLDLKGPSMNIQTACSTSLVAVHVACLHLLTNQCDMAIAGGTFIQTPRGKGYMFKKGEIFSKKGKCRPFDKNADGMLFGEGSGAVVLKRYEDAIRDNDTIHCIIRGTAINNDGSLKVGYVAPGVEGQSKVIAKAFEIAGVSPDDISYIEAHGTGTEMGDPIEITALNKVFKPATIRKQFCAIGSVKANIGHLDAAAGVAGLIKTILALKHKQLPPSINFNSPNPELNIEESPFFINTKLTEWNTNGKSRIAGVSSFGFGGTNAHCIVEEYIQCESQPSEKIYHPVILSAKSRNSLKQQQNNLKLLFTGNNINIADAAYTLITGRKRYKYRSAVFCRNRDQAILKLESPAEGVKSLEKPSLAFVFTGQGSQYWQMAKDLESEFPLFRKIVEEANLVMSDSFGIDIREIIYSESAQDQINMTEFAQPALFIIQYAVYKLLESFGINPAVLIGHSIGEITAACVAGLFSFSDALKMVALRGKLMQAQKPGFMLSVNLSATVIRDILPSGLDISLVNAPDSCVVSGEMPDIVSFRNIIHDKYPAIQTSLLATSHAFHSRMMDPVVDIFKQKLDGMKFGSIRIPLISNVTGKWSEISEIANINYWATQIRSTVLFADGINEIIKNKNTLFVEIGPGISITTLLSQFNTETVKTVSIPTMRHPKNEKNDADVFLEALSQIWINGGDGVFDNYYQNEKRSRISLPTYPFERKKFWIEPRNAFDFNTENEFTEGQGKDMVFNSYNDSQVNDDLSNDRQEQSNEYVAPENEIQKKLVTIWQDLLGIRSIGIIDNFFELGGHSLLASQIINRINEVFTNNIPVETIFRCQNIKELEKVIDKKACSDKSTQKFIKIDRLENLPVSHEQLRLWILSQFDKNPAFNIPFTYRITGNLDVKLFERALEEIIKRHAILRGNIRIDGIDPVLFINQVNKFNITFADLSSFSPTVQSQKIEENLSEVIRKVFDLESEPLYRILLFKESENSYIFHLTIDHLIFDGWSWGIFLKELYQIYTDLGSGKEVSLDLPEYQYYEYSLWQQANADEDYYRNSLSYWIQKLKGHPTEINLPHDFKRKIKNSGLGGRIYFTIPFELNQKLKAFSKKQEVTEFTTYITAFSLLLNKYSGDSDICIGISAASRSNATLEGIIGFFVNTLVLRFDFDINENFESFLKRSKEVVLEALEHQELPFDKLVAALQPPRILNINPVFQVMFSWLSSPRIPAEITQFSMDLYPITDGVSQVDISVYFSEANGLIECEVEYSADIFMRETIDRFAKNYISLLNEIVINYSVALNKLNFISTSERDLIDSFNSTKVTVRNEFVHVLYEEQVRALPFKTALICNDKSLTYSGLDILANKISNYLIEKGVHENEVVGICLNRSLMMVAALLGILKSGAAYLPLDPAFPKERLKYMLDDSGARFLITELLLEDLIHTSISKLLIDRDKKEIERQSDAKPEIKITSDSVAYVMYTSGSTGLPKGVKVHHGAVANFVESMATVPGFSPDDILLSITTLSFDISVLELFLPLYKGGTIVVAQSDEIFNAESIIRLIDIYNITVLQATPATWYFLVQYGWQGNKSLKALCGGEAISKNLISKLLPKVGELWNMYGPTETTVWSTCYKITDTEKPVLVGKPINNTSVYIMSEYGRLRPVGVEGELCIGGKGVSKGYHNRPDLTTEKFIRSPEGDVIYRTGDVGKMLPDGNIELFGRLDNQIKLRGYRIEPGEIEAELCKISGIEEAVVKVHKISEMDERLIAFLRVGPLYNETKDSIILKIGERLPAYMIPRIFQTMNAFPLTKNGKTDRKALIADLNETEKSPSQQPDLKSASGLERKILEIWKSELKMSGIGLNDNFFDMGGNSILLITLADRINRTLGKKIDLINYFQYSTVKSFCSFLFKNNSTVKHDTRNKTRDKLTQQTERRRRLKN